MPGRELRVRTARRDRRAGRRHANLYTDPESVGAFAEGWLASVRGTGNILRDMAAQAAEQVQGITRPMTQGQNLYRVLRWSEGSRCFELFRQIAAMAGSQSAGATEALAEDPTASAIADARDQRSLRPGSETRILAFGSPLFHRKALAYTCNSGCRLSKSCHKC